MHSHPHRFPRLDHIINNANHFPFNVTDEQLEGFRPIVLFATAIDGSVKREGPHLGVD